MGLLQESDVLAYDFFRGSPNLGDFDLFFIGCLPVLGVFDFEISSHLGFFFPELTDEVPLLSRPLPIRRVPLGDTLFCPWSILDDS